MQRLCKKSHVTGLNPIRSCPNDTNAMTIMPVIIKPYRIESALKLSFTSTIKPKIAKIVKVTTLSICVNNQGE